MGCGLAQQDPRMAALMYQAEPRELALVVVVSFCLTALTLYCYILKDTVLLYPESTSCVACLNKVRLKRRKEESYLPHSITINMAMAALLLFSLYSTVE